MRAVPVRRIVTATLAMASVVACGACKKPDPSATQLTSGSQAAAIRVATVAVKEQPMPEYLTVTGSLRASQESEVAADASGKVTQTFVERGQKVKQGDTLLVVDARGPIRAPFAGVVGERYVNVGQSVTPSTRVVSLYNPDPLRLELTVPEANVSFIKLEALVTFTVTSYPDQRFNGAVKLINPNVRPSTRDLVIEALCPNPDGKLRPGMFVVAQLAAGEKLASAVPKTAVRRNELSARVFLVAEKRIQERRVQTGSEKGDEIAIIDGLKAGDQVVAVPGPDVRDGALVQ